MRVSDVFRRNIDPPCVSPKRFTRFGDLKLTSLTLPEDGALVGSLVDPELSLPTSQRTVQNRNLFRPYLKSSELVETPGPK